MKPKALDCCKNCSFQQPGRFMSAPEKLWFPQQSRAFGFIFRPPPFRLLLSPQSKTLPRQ